MILLIQVHDRRLRRKTDRSRDDEGLHLRVTGDMFSPVDPATDANRADVGPMSVNEVRDSPSPSRIAALDDDDELKVWVSAQGGAIGNACGPAGSRSIPIRHGSDREVAARREQLVNGLCAALE